VHPTITQQVVSAHQSQLFAEAAASRLAATATRTTGQAGRTTGTRRLVAAVAAVAALLGGLAH
jgi:hypothetical protein